MVVWEQIRVESEEIPVDRSEGMADAGAVPAGSTTSANPVDSRIVYFRP